MTIISVVQFLMTCLISEIVKDKKRKKTVILYIQKQGKILSLKKQLAKMFNVKIHLNLHEYTSYVDYKVFKNISLRFN